MMGDRFWGRHGRGSVFLSVAVATVTLATPSFLGAQRGGATVSAREAAPIDLTGYWVSIVSEDWRLRMRTAQRGDYDYLPLNEEGERVADRWDPEAALVAGEECMAFGAAGIMRIPARFHFTWEDDSTLRIDTDFGMQTRLLHFDDSAPAGPASTPQGNSRARWRSTGGRGTGSLPAAQQSGELQVVTTDMRAGHFFRHGIPYSDQAVYSEYFVTLEDRGVEYLVLTTILEDPTYLEDPYIRTLHFRREPDGSKWEPEPCAL